MDDVIPSSPLPLPPSLAPEFARSRSAARKEGEREEAEEGMLTVSQLLPDSLMEFSLPRPPVWSEDEVEDEVEDE